MILNQKTHPDQSIIQGIIDNNQMVIGDIYKKYSQEVKAMVQSRGGSVHDAKDLMQEVLMALYRQAQDGLTLTCSFSTFFMLVCRRRWINVCNSRSNKNTAQYLDELEQDIPAECTDIELRMLQEQLFYTKFEQLGPSCKDILSQLWSKNSENGKSIPMQAVAEKLGITYEYIRKKASECRQRLMQLVMNDPLFSEIKSNYYD